MNKNKQIEEMANKIQKSVDGCAEYWATLIAKHLIKQGYRQVKEIIDKVDDMIGGKMIAQALREIYEVE